MKKNGFTLIELLAAIIVLGIVSLVVFPTVDRTIKNQKRKLYDKQISTVIDGAKSWAAKNTNLLPTNTDLVYLGINAIAKEGFLENSDIIDPRNSTKISGCVIINYDSSYKQYNYAFINLNETTNTSCNIDKICTDKNGVVTCN